MAELSLTQDVVPIVERLPKDMIDPEAKRRLIQYTEQLESVFSVDERGRVVADVRALHDLAANGDFFTPLLTKELHEVLSEVEGERELVDENGEMQPLTKAQLEELPRELSVESLDRFVAGLDPELAERLRGLKIVLIGDQPGPEDAERIPTAQVAGNLAAFKDCLKRNLRAFLFALVLAAIGAILAIVGVFVPPAASVAVWIIATFGVIVGGYIIGCLIAAGFLRP
jgi:hypothetical protein